VNESRSGAVVVCDPIRAAALPGVCEHVTVAGVVSTGRRLSTDIARYDTVPHALDAGADRLIALSPYRGLPEDIRRCRERGVPVITAGPASSTDLGLCAAGRWRYQPALARISEAGARSTFGKPVYLRHFGGGGRGLLGLWWAALEGLELAAHLLGGPSRVWVAATGRRGRWHATMTVISDENTTAQLVVTPTAMPGDDSMFLGTGGLVWHEGIRDAVIAQTDDGTRMFAEDAVWPDGPWAAAAVSGTAAACQSAVPDSMRLELLRVLRRAARSGRLDCLVAGET
jgi:hypothetical protein